MSTSDSDNEHSSTTSSHKFQESGKTQLHQRLVQLNSEFETAVRYLENPSELVELLLGPPASEINSPPKIASSHSPVLLSPTNRLEEGSSPSVKIETVSSHSPLLTLKKSTTTSPQVSIEDRVAQPSILPDTFKVEDKVFPKTEMDENLPSNPHTDEVLDVSNEDVAYLSAQEKMVTQVPEAQFIEPRLLKFFSSNASSSSTKKLAEVSIQHEISKAIERHYGAHRPFSVRDTSKKVAASPLAPHLRTGNKALSLGEWQTNALDLSVAKIADKIDALSSRNEWSYRQMKKQPSIIRPLSHWDRLLEEMQWLHADFIEEKKWKVAMASHIAHTVVKWHNSANKTSLCTRNYFKKDGTFNAKWSEKNTTFSPGVFELESNCIVANYNSRLLESMPLYEFFVDEKAIYQDVVEKGIIVPIEKLMESYIRFIPLSNSCYDSNITGIGSDPSNPFHGVDFQGFFYHPMINDSKLSVSNSDEPVEKLNAVEKVSRSWLSAEDQFIRKRAPELGFNWELVASLLNSRSSARLSCQRTSEECSKRWTYVSNIASYSEPPVESKPGISATEDSEKDVKKRTQSRFLLLEEAKKRSCKNREPISPPVYDANEFTCDTPSDSVVELPFTNAIELVKVKLEEEMAKRKKAEPKEVSVPSLPNVQPSLAPVSQVNMLPRLAPAPGLPYPLMARPNFHPSIQAMNYMRANMGMLPNLSLSNVGRMLPEQYQANMSATSHPGLQATSNPALRAMAYNPRMNPALGPMNNFASGGATGSNGRTPIPIAGIRPGAAMTPFNINTPEGRAMASQLTQHNSIIYQRMVQYQQALMRNNQANLHHSAGLNQMQQSGAMDPRLLEQQRLLVRQIQENGATRPAMSSFPSNLSASSNGTLSNNQPTQPSTPITRPRPVLPNGSPTNLPAPSPVSQVAGTPKASKAKAKGPKKPTPVRKKNQKAPDSSLQPPVPVIVTSAVTPGGTSTQTTPSISPHAISPRPVQYIPFSGVNSNMIPNNVSHPLSSQIRYPVGHNMLAQHPNLNQHLMNQHNQLHQLRQLTPGGSISSLQFLPPQFGPVTPNIQPNTPQPSHQSPSQPSLSVAQTPNTTQD